MVKKAVSILACLLLALAAFGQEESSGDSYTPSTTSYSYGSSSSSSSSSSGISRKFGAGYDEGIAARFFFTDRMGVQASLNFQYLGGYDETPNTRELNYISDVQHPETDVGFGAGFILNLFSHDKVLIDAMGQIIAYHDGDNQSSNYGDRMYGVMRIVACPEFIIAERLGFGLKLGLEVVYTGEAQVESGGQVISTDDSTIDVRFYGPQNPFDGPVLGFSLFYYF